MKSPELTVYRDLLGDIKTRVRQAQHRAALSANAEMIGLYWDIGRMIAARQEQEDWGAGVLPRLAVDLKNELPEEKGFSLRNLKLMVQFCRAYPEHLEIWQRAVAQLMHASSTAQIGQPTVARRVPQVAQSRWRENAIGRTVVFNRSTSIHPQLCRSLRHNFRLSLLINNIALG